MTRRQLIITVVVVALIAAGGGGGVAVVKQRQAAAERRAERAAAQSFAQAWQGGTLAALKFASTPGAQVAAAVQAATAGMTSAAKDAPSQVVVTSVTRSSGDKNALSAALQVTWTLAGARTWRYPSSIRFVRSQGRWLPQYEPSVVHPGLVQGSRMAATTTQPERGEILGAGGTVLVTQRPVVVVGLQPSRADDVATSAEAIARVTGIDGAALAKRALAAGKDSFVQAIVLRTSDYQNVRDQLQPIPGAVFQTRTQSLAPTSGFARALLGTVGPATAEIVKSSNGRVGASDYTGLSGVQEAYDAQLAGTDGLVVTSSTPAVSGTAATRQTLFSAAAVPGTSLQLTLDQTIQEAAEAALEKATKPAALVALRVGTGAVLAVANGGPNASGYDRALLGRYPPGSTFKVASTLGLLGTGLTPQTTVNCPATVTVGGRTFKNAEAEKYGAVPFHTDFANSCNTAFVASSTRLSVEQLAAAAKSLGYGQPNKLGVSAFTGSVPTTGDAVAHAAAMIGQDTVLASPVTVAGASAAVASGRWVAPRLVLAKGETLDADGSAGTALPAASDAVLKDLMREVVTSGTATALRSVPGGEVSGKTGTAEFGNDDPPQTHAWFTGFQGDVAFAVVVEGGGFGAKAAVPIVKDFLTRLAG